jgi:aspartate-semialdehyde dehydrogenase
MRSHSESITAEFERPISPDEAREILSSAPGVRVVDDPDALRYPMPLDTSDQDLVFVGRIRRDLSAPDGVSALTLFCCGDQIRKGAATNAVQIAEYLV